MWRFLFGDVAWAIAFFYIPGFLAFRMIGIRPLLSLGFSPLLAFLAVSIVAHTASCALIPLSPFAFLSLSIILIFVLAICIRLFVCRRKVRTDFNMPTFRQIALAVGISLVIGLLFFILPLDGAESFYQENDNIAHLEVVKQYLDSGIYADGGSFLASYPSLWRTLAAMVAGLGSGSVTIAVNAVNFAIVVFLFPISMLFFVCSFIKDKRVLLLSPLLTLSFVVFPWGFLYFGPLYPNLIGYSVLPLVMALVVYALYSVDLKSFLYLFVAFLASCSVLARAHPSAIFVGIVVMSPYIAFRINVILSEKGAKPLVRRVSVALFVVSMICLWTLLFASPMFRGVVTFDWAPYTGKVQAVANVLFLGLTKSSAVQLSLSLLVLIGAMYCLVMRRWRWLLCSHLLVSLIYIACVSFPVCLQHFFAGFWYNDSFRVAAMFVFTGMPLACIGLASVIRVAEAFVKLVVSAMEEQVYVTNCLTYVIPAVAVIVIFFPSFTFAQNITWTTGFGKASQMLRSGNSLAENANAIDSHELEFLEMVKDEVGDDIVLNYPYDGSAYAQTLADVNVVNRGWFGYSPSIDGKKSNYQLLCESIDKVASDHEVSDAARSEDIKYVLLLDNGAPDVGGCYYTVGYDGSYWHGLEMLDDSTPGFSIVLSQGDMRLYKID